MAAVRLALVLVALLRASLTYAQPTITLSHPGADIFIHDWDDNEATVSVTERSGLPRRGLTKDSFVVMMDGRNRKIKSVDTLLLPNAKALGLSFVLDNSASIFHGYDSITKYLDAFIKGIPGDVLMNAYVFDDKDRSRMHEATRRGDVWIAPFGPTTDRDSISRFWHFYDTVRSEFTPLYDQVGLALWNIQRRKDYGDTNRLNVVIVISDGTDNASRTSIEDLLDLVLVSDVRLFVLTYRTEPDRRLSWLSNRARGASATLESLPALDATLEQLRSELMTVYKIRFATDRGKRRDLPKSLPLAP
jgi:hypothetical protein